MDDPSIVIRTLALPAVLLLMALEAVWLMRLRRQAYPWREAAASLGIAIGNRLTQAAAPLLLAPVYLLAWEYRVATVPLDTWWGLAALFLAVELAYYWMHRLSHECRWLWATHSVHHSPRHLNLTAAYRLGWTNLISGQWLFWLPLIVVGFHPVAVFTMLAVNLLYQFWLHTELVPRLGPLEWLLNTPSHHRVHHATNPAYLDRNYGGVLIVFDRLFGSVAAERADTPCRYGLVRQIDSHNPFAIAFNEWRGILRDLRHADGWRSRLGFAFGPPGWSPDGSRETTASIRASASRRASCRRRPGSATGRPGRRGGLAC